MNNVKEIFIEIDESGTLNEKPSVSTTKDYLFLACSFVAEKNENPKNNKVFHYRELIFSTELTKEEKIKALMGLATKIQKKNVYYSCLKIDKRDIKDDDYEYECANLVYEHFYKLLIKLTKNNNLKININYDRGQKDYSRIINRAIKDFRNKYHKPVSLLTPFTKKNANHGYADFLVSIEKVRLKISENNLGIIESSIYEDTSFYSALIDKIKDKNIDEIKFNNFKKLLESFEAK